MKRLFWVMSCGVSVTGLSVPFCAAMAQTSGGNTPAPPEPAGSQRPSQAERLMDDIVVTARKKSAEEGVQTVPLAVTAFSGAQLEARQVHNLSDLTVATPNVALDGAGNFKGVANFTIRGLGINSSIPSIDPTVGVFVDGVYLGVNYGVILDTFDLEDVEVLRGPQGVLFGKNVTGGAVLIKTRAPSDSFQVRLRANAETGPEYGLAGSVESPLIEGTLFGKLTGYYKKDEGFFRNDAKGGHKVGEDETYFIRPSLRLVASDDINFVVRLEAGKTKGNGLLGQNSGRTQDFDVAFDQEGFTNLKWYQATGELTWHLAGGTLTNTFGWRSVKQGQLSDIDATPADLFTAEIYLNQHQWSNELRYARPIGTLLDLTTGLFYFQQDILYRERRRLAGGAVSGTLGGDQDQNTIGVFAAGDVHLTSTFDVNLGIRYTREHKSAQIATLNLAASLCNFDARSCNFDFDNARTWSSLMPLVGFQWQPNTATNLYGHWTKGFRSGGYNFRNTSRTASPGPFDQEEQDAFEVGFKTKLAGNRIRWNTALFFNNIRNMQREVLTPDATAGVAQVIRNTADAHIYGVESELTALVARGLVLNASLGYTHGRYTSVRQDINGDGRIDAKDRALDLPRLANWTYSLGASYSHTVGSVGSLTARTDYGYRDKSAFSDNNLAVLPKFRKLSASLEFSPPGENWTLGVYGQNLLNQVTWSSETILPAAIGGRPLGGSLRPIGEGRVVGVRFSAHLQ